MRKLISVIVYALFTIALIHGQTDHNIKYQSINFRNLTIDEGLTNNHVRSVYRDKKGFIWFGTIDGLNRYDGYEVKRFKTTDDTPSKLTANIISSIVEDKNSFLWLGTAEHGLQRYDPKTGEFLLYKSKLKDATLINRIVDCLRTTPDNFLIIGTREGVNTLNLNKYNAKEPEFKTIKDNTGTLGEILEKEQVYDILVLPNHTICLSTYSHFLCLKLNSDYTQVEAVLHRLNITSRGLAMDRNGAVWFAQYGTTNYLYRLKLNGTKEVDVQEMLLPAGINNIQDIAIDQNNHIWLDNHNRGLYQFDIDINTKTYRTLSFSVYNRWDTKSLADNEIRQLLIDDHNILWLGTQRGGVCFYDINKKQFKTYTSTLNSKSLSSGNIGSIHEDSSQNLWIGTLNNGLNVLPNGSANYWNGFKRFPYAANDASANAYTSIEKTSDKFWIGEIGHGMISFRFSPDFKITEENFYTPNKGVREFLAIFSILQEGDSILWAGTYFRGLIRFVLNKEEEIVSYKTFPIDRDNSTSLQSPIVRNIYKRKNGDIWLGTGGGLTKLIRNPKDPSSPSFITFRKGESDSTLSHNFAMQILETKDNNFWIGTRGGGLNKMIWPKDGSDPYFINYGEKDGFPSNIIASMLEDNSGNLWVSTSSGFVKFNPETEKIKQYSTADGLPGSVFNDIACYQRKNGEMLFGGKDGLLVFYPDSIRENKYKPSLTVSSIRIGKKELNSGDTLISGQIIRKTSDLIDSLGLSYKENDIELVFSALHYADPLNNQYKYKLEGFDNEWISTSSKRRFATYMNLPAGEYSFKLMGSNNDGLWADEPKIVKITVFPPFWKTTWFRLLLFAFIFGTIVLLYYLRVQQLNFQKKMLEKLVKERTYELQNANSELEEQKEEITQQKEEIILQKEEILAQRDGLEISFNNTKLLSEIGQEVTAKLNLKDISQIFLTYIGAMMDVFEFGIGTYNDQRKSLNVSVLTKDKQRDVSFPIGTNENENNRLLAWCFRNNKPIFTNNITAEYQAYVKTLLNDYIEKQIYSVISIPLLLGETPIGVIMVNSQKPDAYSETDFSNLKVLAAYVAVALDNAKAYQIVNHQNENIKGSIRYAQSIQNAILPSETYMKKHFDVFSIFLPKDIVSGDFYWQYTAQEHGKEYTFLAVVDCTGHGVPGALLSMIGSNLLDAIVKEQHILEPDQILASLNNLITKFLRQQETGNKDGMDLCIIRIEKSTKDKRILQFAGAKRPLFIHTENKVNVIKGSRFSIGGKLSSRHKLKYDLQELTIPTGSMLYLSTDGYSDQANMKRIRFGTRNFLALLQKIATKPLEEQRKVLLKALKEHQGNALQRDDITLLGVRVL